MRPRSPRRGDRGPDALYRSATELDPAMEPEAFNRPVLVLHPAEDRTTDMEFTRRFVRRLGGRARFVTLDGCGHFPVEEPGARMRNEHLFEFFRAVP